MALQHFGIVEGKTLYERLQAWLQQGEMDLQPKK